MRLLALIVCSVAVFILVIVCDSLYQVGFEMIDSISQAQGILMNTIQSKALIGIGGSSAIFLFILVIFFFYSRRVWYLF